MNKEEKLQNLLKLKRNETPGDAYFDAFVGEFHRYQRSEVLEGRKSWFVRLKRGLEEVLEDLLVTPARIAQGGAVSFGVLLLSVALYVGNTDTENATDGFAATPGIYVDGTEFNSNPSADQAELVMAHLTSFENDFEGSKYVTGGATMSHGSVITF